MPCMAGPARQFEHGVPSAATASAILRFSQGAQGRCAFSGDVELQRKPAAFGERLDQAHDIGDRQLYDAGSAPGGADAPIAKRHSHRDHVCMRSAVRVDGRLCGDQARLVVLQNF